jgi:hypothetical protein
MLFDGSDSNTASIGLGYANAIVSAFAAEIRGGAQNLIRRSAPGAPVESRLRIWYNSQLKSKNYIVPGLIALILMIIGALLTSLTLAREWEMGTMEQLLSTPLRPAEVAPSLEHRRALAGGWHGQSRRRDSVAASPRVTRGQNLGQWPQQEPQRHWRQNPLRAAAGEVEDDLGEINPLGDHPPTIAPPLTVEFITWLLFPHRVHIALNQEATPAYDQAAGQPGQCRPNGIKTNEKILKMPSQKVKTIGLVVARWPNRYLLKTATTA